MTTVSLIEYNPDKGSRHSPSTPTKGLDKTKVAKIGSLTAANRSREGSCTVNEIQGLSLLNTELTHTLKSRTAIRRKPREIDLLPQRPSTTQYYQHTFYDPACAKDEIQTGPLSVNGEKLDALSNLQFRLPSTPLTHRRQYYISQSYSSTTCSECSQCGGRSSPDNPPSSPNPEASYLKLNGKKMSCPDFRSKSELKDFKPGLLKKTSYCCVKCEGRMISHDTLMLESESPFQSYFRQPATYAETLPYNSIKPLHSDKSLETCEELIIDQPLKDSFLKDDMFTLPELPHPIANEKVISKAVLERGKCGQKSRLSPRYPHHNQNIIRADENEELLSSACIISNQIFHSSNKTEIINEETTSQQFKVSTNETNDIHQNSEEKKEKDTKKRAVDGIINLLWPNQQPCEKYLHSPITLRERPNIHPRENDLHSPVPTWERLNHQPREKYSHLVFPSSERPNYKPCEKCSHLPVISIEKSSSMSTSDLIQSEVAEEPPSPGLEQCEEAKTPPSLDLSQIGLTETPLLADLGTPYNSNTDMEIGIHLEDPSISVSIHNLPSNSSSKDNAIRIEAEIFKTESVKQTLTNAVYSKDEFIGRVNGMESREMLQDIMRECAKGLRDISHRGFLPDISARNDFYFEPNTDKRYNRWKRRRKKKSKQGRDGKQQELVSPDDSSAEEEANEEEESIAPERPDSQPKFCRRRRETLKKLFGSEQAMLCYDASSDLTSSDRDNYMSGANNLRTSHRAPISDEEFDAFKDKSNDGMHLSSPYNQQEKYTSSIFLQQLGSNIERSVVSTKTETQTKDGMQLTEGFDGNDTDIIKRVNSRFKMQDRQTQNRSEIKERKCLERHHNEESKGNRSKLPQNRNVEGLNVEIIHRGKHAEESSFVRKKIISCENGGTKLNRMLELASPENDLITSPDNSIKHGYLSAPDQASAAGQVFNASSCRQNLSAPNQVLDASCDRKSFHAIDQMLDASDYQQNSSSADQLLDADDYRQSSPTADQVLDTSGYHQNSHATNQMLDASDYRQNSSSADQHLDADDYRQNSPTADQVLDASGYRQSSPNADHVLEARGHRQNSSDIGQGMDASDCRQYSLPDDHAFDACGYRQNSSDVGQGMDASECRQNSSTDCQVLEDSCCRQSFSDSNQVLDASSYRQNNVRDGFSEPILQKVLHSSMNSTSECDSDPFIRVETVLRNSQQYGNLSNQILTKDSSENFTGIPMQSSRHRFYNKDRKSDFNTILDLERSVLKLAKQHHQKNQSLSNKKYSEGQLKPKLPNIHDVKASTRSTDKAKQLKNFRNILDRFVKPLDVQNVEENNNPYLKENDDVLVTTTYRHRKENPVIKNDKLKREKRSQRQPLSKKLNNSTEQSVQEIEPAETELAMLTLNQLLQTMPGNKVKKFIQKVTKKITSDQSDQDSGKELPALDVKKLNMIAKAYTDSEQEEASPKCLGEQTKSLPNQIKQTESSRPHSHERSISNLSFSRAFTFSVFDLPDGYREKNKQLQRRAYNAVKSR